MALIPIYITLFAPIRSWIHESDCDRMYVRILFTASDLETPPLKESNFDKFSMLI